MVCLPYSGNSGPSVKRIGTFLESGGPVTDLGTPYMVRTIWNVVTGDQTNFSLGVRPVPFCWEPKSSWLCPFSQPCQKKLNFHLSHIVGLLGSQLGFNIKDPETESVEDCWLVCWGSLRLSLFYLPALLPFPFIPLCLFFLPQPQPPALYYSNDTFFFSPTKTFLHGRIPPQGSLPFFLFR